MFSGNVGGRETLLHRGAPTQCLPSGLDALRLEATLRPLSSASPPPSVFRSAESWGGRRFTRLGFGTVASSLPGEIALKFLGFYRMFWAI